MDSEISKDKRKYSKINAVDRQRLIDAYCKQEDCLRVAEFLNIKYITARSIISTFYSQGRVEPKQRGGARHCKITNDIKETILKSVDENPVVTLKNICA